MDKRSIAARVSGLSLLALVMVVEPSRADGPSVEVPFQWKGGHIVVEGSIGNLRGLNLVIDTGASSTTVSRRIARKLALEGTKKEVFAYAHRVEVEEVRLPDLQIGALHLEDVPAWSMERLTPADARETFRMDALIGLDLLRKTNLTIDLESETLRFGPTNVGEDSQPFYPNLPFLVLRLSIGGETLGVMLDSGAEDLILYRNQVEDHVAMRRSRETKEVRHAGGKGRLHKVQLSQVALGKSEWPELDAFLMEGRTGPSGLDGVLGIRALGLKRLALDFQTNRIGWER